MKNKASSLSSKFIALVAAVCLALAGLALAGCSSNEATSADEGSSATPEKVRIGTMPTEDILPAWVAESDGIFAEYGIDAEVISFDSAPSLSAAITAGEVDMAMTDIMRSIKLTESGADVVMEWVTLGQTPEQGRFGILTRGDAPYNTLEEMAAYVQTAGVSDETSVGVAANTVPEYVFDMLCEEQGIEAGAIPTVEVASIPDRYSLMASGGIGAAALPASLLELGENTGMKLLADDTQGENISQSVMVARASFAQEHPEAIMAVAKAWDAAVDAIDENPDAYRDLLIEKANINSNIADVYPISRYPYALEGVEIAHPELSIVEPQIIWMREKGYGGATLTYDEATGEIVLG